MNHLLARLSEKILTSRQAAKHAKKFFFYLKIFAISAALRETPLKCHCERSAASAAISNPQKRTALFFLKKNFAPFAPLRETNIPPMSFRRPLPPQCPSDDRREDIVPEGQESFLNILAWSSQSLPHLSTLPKISRRTNDTCWALRENLDLTPRREAHQENLLKKPFAAFAPWRETNTCRT